MQSPQQTFDLWEKAVIVGKAKRKTLKLLLPPPPIKVNNKFAF